MTTATTARHTCARCGRRQTVETMVFSTHTRNRYCRDLNACAKRARRTKVAA